jgi:hypothetical protein
MHGICIACDGHILVRCCPTVAPTMPDHHCEPREPCCMEAALWGAWVISLWRSGHCDMSTRIVQDYLPPSAPTTAIARAFMNPPM